MEIQSRSGIVRRIQRKVKNSLFILAFHVEPVGICHIHYDGSVRVEVVHYLLLLIHADQYGVQLIRIVADLDNLEARIGLIEPQVIPRSPLCRQVLLEDLCVVLRLPQIPDVQLIVDEGGRAIVHFKDHE